MRITVPSNITSAQLRAARAMLKIEQGELAARSGVSIPTIKRMEAGDGPLSGQVQNVSRIIDALEAAGVEFIPENGGGAGVRLRERREQA